MKKWTIEDAKELYNINGWGTSYFGINEKGDVYVSPCKDNTQIDLRDVMDELALRMSLRLFCSVFLTSLTTGLKRRGAVLRRRARSTTTKEKTMWSIPSR